MVDYNDPNDPNYDPYWGDKVTSCSGPASCPDLSDFELEEIEETYIQEMREEGLLRPTVVRPGEQKAGPGASKNSVHIDERGEVSF